MTRTISLVQRVQIASPCRAKWDDMAGDDRARFCSQCKLNVYNLSAMTEAEGEALIREKDGKLCARIYRRYDGTILTRDCPVGLRAIRRRVTWLAMRAAAAMFLVVTSAVYAIEGGRPRNQEEAFEQAVKGLTMFNAGGSLTSNSATLTRIRQWLTCEPAPTRGWLGGDMAIVPPSPQSPVPPRAKTGG